MKNLNKYFTVFPMAVVIIMGLSNCTKHDQVIDLTPPATDVPPILNTSILNAVQGTATLNPVGDPALSWDGTIESVWNNAPKLTVTGVVPDLGNGTFDGFIGNSTNITLRSMYDASNIYFLVEFDAAEKNVKSSQWYYNPTTKRWAQEAGAPTLNSDGTYRPAAAQDQFVMMFNVANSCKSFNTLSCYAACHKNSSFGGATTTGGVMYTNGPTEVLDVWRARMNQVVNTNQANDCFIDDGSSVGLGYSGALDKNEVHGDWQTLNGPSSSVPPAFQSAGKLVSSPGATAVYAADGGFGNKQSLKMTGTNTRVAVPIWVRPGTLGTNPYSNSAIMLSDTLSGSVVKVVAVDTNGVLTLANLTTIDPRTAASGVNYQQVGSGDGANSIPGSIVGPYTDGRGDVNVNAFYTGTGWRILFKRSLTTSHSVDNGHDADFSSKADMPFGVGAMFNGADNQHAIVAGLTLHFQ